MPESLDLDTLDILDALDILDEMEAAKITGLLYPTVWIDLSPECPVCPGPEIQAWEEY